MQLKRNGFCSVWGRILWILAVPATAALWAVFASAAGCALGGGVAGVYFIVTDNGLPGLATVAAGLFCAGLSVFLFFGCREATKAVVRRFLRKGAAQ